MRSPFVRERKETSVTDLNITVVDGGSAEYWMQRGEGFRLIHEAERAAQRLAEAPVCLRGGHD